MEEEINFEEILAQLNSEDSAERLRGVEQVMYDELPDDVLVKMCSLLTDEDKGVRNVVSMALIVNGNSKIPENIIQFVSSKDISIRNLSGEVLLKIGDASIDALESYIAKGDDDDKKFVVDVMGLIRNQKPGNSILELLKVTDDDNVALACVEALGNIKYEKCLEYLPKVYEQNELFKTTVIEAMGKIGSKAALDFMQLIYSKEDDLTKFSLIESFGLVGDESIFFFLLSELNEVEGALMYPLLESIYLLKEKYGFDIPFDEKMKNIILTTLNDADPQYKKVAALLVSEFEDKDIILACLKIWGEDSELDEAIKPKFFSNPKILLNGILALLRSTHKNVKSLLYLLQEIVVFEGLDITIHIGPLEVRDLTDSFSKCLENPDEEVRKTATELLFHTDIDTAFLFIDTMLDDDNMWNKLKLLEILDSISGEKADEALKKLAEDPEEMINERAKLIIEER
ncbi:MAG: HEAT repeat domain-containing protein [Bacteroidetes bacterium]|nr:HEAT repeat domain-containing protein [Bacteroidota bacterium]